MDPDYEREKQARMRSAQHYVFGSLTLLSTAAVICGATATGYCAFLHRNTSLQQQRSDDPLDCSSVQDPELCRSITEARGVGFYGWQAVVPPDNQLTCLGYTSFIPGKGWVTLEPDGLFYVARACAYVANFFGLIAFFTLVFSTCCPLHPTRMPGVSLYFFFATVFQASTLLLTQSDVCEREFFWPFYVGTDFSVLMDDADVSCSLDTGAALAIAATVLYFWCMLVAPGALPPEPVGGNPFETEPLRGEK